MNESAQPDCLEEQAAEDRLHDAGFLVERLLDEKGVVLDLEGGATNPMVPAAVSVGESARPHDPGEAEQHEDNRQHVDQQLRRGARPSVSELASLARTRTLSDTSSRASTTTAAPA